MWTCSDDFRAFYESRQGELPGSVLSGVFKQMWPDVRGNRVVGLGYPVAFLDSLSQGATCTISLCTHRTGSARWPTDRPCRVARVDARDLPLPDRTVDRLLLVHALEFYQNPREVLRESWRVLADHGTMILVMPNRTGLWSCLDASPFSCGQSTTRTEMTALLQSSLFAIRQIKNVLFCPPLAGLSSITGPMERIGALFGGVFSGVIVICAHKQMTAPIVSSSEIHRQRRRCLTPLGTASQRGGCD